MEQPPQPLTPHQQQAMEMDQLFEGVDFVRLRSGRAYVHAAEDGRSVCLDTRRASHNAVWAVTRSFCDTTHCVFLRGAYGRYLGAPDATAGSSLCRAATQRDFDNQLTLAILWQAIPTTRRGVYQLRDASGRYYLRANARCLLPCRPAVSVSTRRGLGKSSQWVVEPVPRGRRPELSGPRDSLWSNLFAHVPLSAHCMRWFSEREIRWVRAEQSGVFSEEDMVSEQYTGRSTFLLYGQLYRLLPPHVALTPYTLCVRAGRFGQPTPLAIDLPRSQEPLDVVLFLYTVIAEDRFIYPDVDAAAGAAADEEPLLR